jgi:hypothetical protein
MGVCVTESVLKEFTVTFAQHLDEHFVQGFYETGFLGLCENVKRASDPKVLRLWPRVEEHRALKAQLEELEESLALSFTEKPAEFRD